MTVNTLGADTCIIIYPTVSLEGFWQWRELSVSTLWADTNTFWADTVVPTYSGSKLSIFWADTKYILARHCKYTGPKLSTFWADTVNTLWADTVSTFWADTVSTLWADTNTFWADTVSTLWADTKYILRRHCKYTLDRHQHNSTD